MKRSGLGEKFERVSKRIAITIVGLYIFNLIILIAWVLNVV